MRTTDLIDKLNGLADQLAAAGSVIIAAEIRAAAVELTRQQIVIEQYEAERLSRLRGIGSPE